MTDKDKNKQVPTEYREPARKAMLVALSGAVAITTPDGNSVVLDPEVAMTIAREMPAIAHLAMNFVDPPDYVDPPEVKDPLSMPYLFYGKDGRMCPN